MKLYRIFCPPRYAVLRKLFSVPSFNVLDVGCGHQSYEIFRYYFPQATYHGVDKRLLGEQEQYKKMDRFFDVDLETATFDEVPDEHYDAIVFSHTIEHLFHGHEVLAKLVKKIKIGGFIYLEFPSVHSMYLPSADGTLSFFDDPTHLRMYDI